MREDFNYTREREGKMNMGLCNLGMARDEKLKCKLIYERGRFSMRKKRRKINVGLLGKKMYMVSLMFEYKEKYILRKGIQNGKQERIEKCLNRCVN